MESSVNHVNEQSDNEADDDKDSVESEESEPKLKYSRMSNDLQTILSNEAASCVAVHPKFVCIGTDWGIIHLLDHQGNNIFNIPELKAHSVAVNQISIDANGDHIASCSDDGKVFVYGLYNSDNNHSIMLGRLVRSVAIDPNYYKTGSGRRFITGDERLVLHEKTFLSRLRSTVINDASHEGGVKSIRWSPGSDLIAWASHLGFRVYDITSKVSLGLIKWSRSTDVDLKCHLCWKDSGMLIVGWADTVRVCVVNQKAPHLATPADISPYEVRLIYIFQTEFIVSGVGPLGDWLVVLGSNKDGERPQLHVIEPAPSDYINLSTDSLSLRGYPKYTSSDYSLECLVEESRYVIVSPKDIVVACPLDTDDRIQWLIDHRKFDVALQAVSDAESDGSKPPVKHNTLSVGRVYLDHLLSVKDYKKAAALCQKILGNDKRLWEKEVYKFARVHQLRAVSNYLPMGDDRLPKHVYEMVLYEFLKMEPKGFLTIVKKWPANLYNVPAVVNAVLEHILVSDPKTNPTLLEALAVLYSRDGKHDKALAMYIKLQNKGVFQLIQNHNLYSEIHNMVEGLMGLDSEKTIATLLEKDKAIDPEVIVSKLQSKREYLYLYLSALDNWDTRCAQKYHGELVKLYSDYAKDKLLPLLKKSDHYPIKDALDICKQRMFHAEMVYLLGRIGNTKEALALITEKLGNIEEAVDFCKEHDDQDLWEDLISYSLKNESFIIFLLKRIGTYIDPRILVQKIDNYIKIPGLKDALVKMLQDYNLQVSVQEGCKKILVSDYFNLHHRLVSMQQRGTSVGDEQFCGVCLRKVLIRGGKDTDQPSNIMVFNCNHLFHTACLSPEVETCSICTSQKHMFSQRQN